MKERPYKAQKPGIYRNSMSRYACFECRKCFHHAMTKCPQCEGVTHSVGRHFRAPQSRDIKSWEIIKKMVVLLGKQFSGQGAGIIPTSQKQLDEKLQLAYAKQDPSKDLEHKNTNKEDGKIKPKKFRRNWQKKIME